MDGSELFLGVVRFALPTVPVIFAVRYVYFVFWKPEKILKMEDDSRAYRPPWSDRGPWYRIWAILHIILAMVGIGIFIYGGTRSSMSGLPSWLGTLDEDGQYVTVREAISFFAATCAPLFVMQWLLRHAISNARRRQNVDAE